MEVSQGGARIRIDTPHVNKLCALLDRFRDELVSRLTEAARPGA